MKPIAFIDTEVDPQSQKILDIGCVKDDGNTFHSGSMADFTKFLKGATFICGHNIFNHDLKYIQKAVEDVMPNTLNVIDTLYLSPLLFPQKRNHPLTKDYKLQFDESNSPLNDAIITKELLYDEVNAFKKENELFQQILYLLLHDRKEFHAFFSFIGYESRYAGLEEIIREKFYDRICTRANLTKMIAEHPVELAYCLAHINCNDRNTVTPPWVLKNYPDAEQIMFSLRNKPCISGCTYCNEAFDIHKALKKYFGFNAYRTYASEPLQEYTVQSAVNNKSILAVFPTGGGKSVTFQIPALMSGENSNALTVVISPLQSLMKDQVDNLEKNGITDAVTINGLLDVVERSKALRRVEDDPVSILYISPESLRSKTIERLLLGRKIARFVIDEAHCFSSWGQDFRIDYLYVGDFIKSLQEKKNIEDAVPVSCFTATARQEVMEDIRNYFKEKLNVNLEVFRSKASRTNLHYRVVESNGEEEKYNRLRNFLESRKCPAIIYVSRTRKAYFLAERLTHDGFHAKPYHGKMNVHEKTANQNAFLSGEVPIMVATSAFGMGVDKKDIGMVIHYEISDSLENYIQEAGRAGRDENITAECFVLFSEDDLDKHFVLLNQTKLGIREIQQVWKAVKEITRFHFTTSSSPLEIARKAGWGDNVDEIETRVIMAIGALENAGYLKRGQNMPRIFADSIQSKTAQEAIDKIKASKRFSEYPNENLEENAIRIIKKLFSTRSRKHASDEAAESRIDYISDHLGISKEKVIKIVNLLREEKILADAKDLTAFIRRGENKNRSLSIMQTFSSIENFLLSVFEEEEKTFHLKELNELATKRGCKDVTPGKIKTIINFWAVKMWIKRRHREYSKDHVVAICIKPKAVLKEKFEKRRELAAFITEFLYQKSSANPSPEETGKEEVLVEFSVHELREAYDKKPKLFDVSISIEDIEDTLFYLSRINAIKIEGGFLVVYNALSITRVEQDNRKRFTTDDYQKLHRYYESKVMQIHIAGEYARKMMEDPRGAQQFAEDYFHLNHPSFLNKYFKGSRQDEIKKTITPAKHRQLFGELSPVQAAIIHDNTSKYIVVAAGPGSGKTKVLVHKLASLLLMEDVKHEQLLMVTFSRAAATEFRKRLMALIKNAANYIEIKTFHAYCFDLLGQNGTLEKSGTIIKEAIEKIKKGEVEKCPITKTVLVIDEAQDMDDDEFALVNTLMEQNEDMRVIAVGDDDQNIFEFRGSSAKYLSQLIDEKKAVKYELTENYRSRSNLVEFTNSFVQQIRSRLKKKNITAHQQGNGKIKVVRHHSGNLITPLVHDILQTGLSGTTCVLAKTNEEALQITGLLLKNGLPAKLIQTNDGFNLYNLQEVRFFLDQLSRADDVFIISDDTWKKAKQELINRFRSSSKLEACTNIIKEFEATHPKRKYKSDLEVFIRESRLEDFFNENGEIIFVSTIHKAKGKEFDNVFLMLENVNPSTDETRRQLYVATTRAKQNLTIHLNESYLDNITAEALERTDDRTAYSLPNELVMHLAHEDVNLGYFKFIQHRLINIVSGDLLVKVEGGYGNSDGGLVLKFSRKFTQKLAVLEKKGFQLKEVKAGFILYWKSEEMEEEIKIILPELYFEREGISSKE